MLIRNKIEVGDIGRVIFLQIGFLAPELDRAANWELGAIVCGVIPRPRVVRQHSVGPGGVAGHRGLRGLGVAVKVFGHHPHSIAVVQVVVCGRVVRHCVCWSVARCARLVLQVNTTQMVAR